MLFVRYVLLRLLMDKGETRPADGGMTTEKKGA